MNRKKRYNELEKIKRELKTTNLELYNLIVEEINEAIKYNLRKRRELLIEDYKILRNVEFKKENEKRQQKIALLLISYYMF